MKARTCTQTTHLLKVSEGICTQTAHLLKVTEDFCTKPMIPPVESELWYQHMQKTHLLKVDGDNQVRATA